MTMTSTSRAAGSGCSHMLRAVCLLALLGVAAAQTPHSSQLGEAWELAQRATGLAREGRASESLDLYRAALALAPASMEIRRDYAVALGWAEKYAESKTEFRQVLALEPDQPVWALREMARTELFGDDPAAALTLLDRLIAMGDRSETTLLRRALALRWLNRAAEAETAYRAALVGDPQSDAAQLGLVYALADQEQLSKALAAAEGGLAGQPENWQFAKAKGLVLNRMGFHLEAQSVLDSIPSAYATDRETRESRAAAARWGGQPRAAQKFASSLAEDFPRNASAVELNRDLELAYGYSFTPSARMIHDSDGLVDRLYAQDFSLHANPAHRFDLGYQYRRFSQVGDSVLAWRRYGAGWQGTLSRRLSGQVAVSSVDYLQGASGQRFFPEASAAYFFSDRARLMVGAGQLPMDAFRSVQNHVTAGYYYGNLLLRPHHRLTVETQYARYNFSDDVRRDRVDLSAFQRLYSGRRLRLDTGVRANFLWHDRETPNFFSPTFFRTYLAAMRAGGRLSERLEYNTEVGFGAQQEPFVATQSPLAVSGALSVRLRPSIYLSFEAGRTTASIERVNPGRAPYARRFASVSLNIRLPKSGERGGVPRIESAETLLNPGRDQ
jgi:tetratricopeptide (TPR) repeat protein